VTIAKLLVSAALLTFAAGLHAATISAATLPVTGPDGGGSPAPKATDLYVATNGDDNAAGTQATPFQTLAKAQAAVRALQPIGAPITVWVRGGTYYLTSPLVFTPADSGSANAPITYAA